MKAVAAIAVTALAAVNLYGCGGDTTTTAAPTTPSPPTMNIVQLANATASLSTLTSLLESHGLVDTLSGTGPFTVFAPTNEAFTAAQAVIDTLSADQITQVLTYHVVPDVAAQSTDLTQGQSLPTVFADHNLMVDTVSPDVTIKPDGADAADAKVTTANVMATNGVVHIVDHVLVPDLAAPAPSPSSAGTTTAAPSPAGTTTPAATQNIVELAQATPTLSTLVDLLSSHNLVETLSGPGPFTVFAPVNDAFTAAQATIDTLSDDQVTSVLTYHVVPDAAAQSTDLTQGQTLATVFTPHNLIVDTISPDVTIKPDGTDAADATVTQANIIASNGVIHVVDTVLVPDLASLTVEVV